MKNVFTFFEFAAKNYPQNHALFVDDAFYTYKSLFQKAAFISGMLPPDSSGFAGVFAHRSLTAFAGVLGVLKSGKGYIPLNPKFPAQRIATIIEQSEIQTIVVEEAFAEKLAEVLKLVDRPLNLAFPFAENADKKFQDIIHQHHKITHSQGTDTFQKEQQPVESPYAYMLFTSGSTGKPKGVPVKHENVVAYVANMNNMFDFSSEDRFSNTFDLTFDLSVHDLFVSWSNGATLYCIPGKSLMAPARFIKKHALTSWFSVPSLANVMSRLRMLQKDAFPSLRYTLFCGEPLPETLALKWQQAAPYSRMVNIYGPTEATIGITAYEITGESRKSQNGILSIGKAFPGNTALVMDEQQREVNGDEPGELWLKGTQVTEGYWKQPEKTAEAFVFLNGIWHYKTGDLVKKDAEGDLFYLGRKDFQAKIQGYRVETQEIDFVITDSTDLQDVVTLPIDDGLHNTKLVTCIAGNETKIIEKEKIYDICKAKLPDYMVPEYILFFESFPLNQNAKTDRKALLQWVKVELGI